MAHTYAHDFDPSVHRAGYIPGTDFTLPHLSRFSIAHDDETHMLRHMNCSLLSTPGVPPTLLALKQHAQSLAYLISMLNPHGGDEEAVEVLLGRAKKASKAGSGTDRANKRRKTDTNVSDGSLLHNLVLGTKDTAIDNPFDWLDLSQPYTNKDDPSHNRPLIDLVNEVKARHDVLGTTYTCPLTTYTPRNGGRFSRGADSKEKASNDDDREWDEDNLEKPRPYASNHGLLLHANMCLERLDHEYAATGGLLSLLPISMGDKKEDEGPELKAAHNTLVGQWLTFTQNLVGRTHELETAYANALHLLQGQASSAPTGAEADRWQMINANDVVWADVHSKIDKAAEADSSWGDERREQGVSGEQASSPETNHTVYVDINTRFYRVDVGGSHSRGPIYVCPIGAPGNLDGIVDPSGRGSAAAVAAANVAGDKLAQKVRLVSATALEQRYDRRLQEAGRLARVNKRLTEQSLQKTQSLLALHNDHKRVQALNKELQKTTGEVRQRLKKAEAELAGLKKKATAVKAATTRRTPTKPGSKSKSTATVTATSKRSSKDAVDTPDGATRKLRRRGRGPADSNYRNSREGDSPSGEE